MVVVSQGAEIEGLVKSACSYALDRKVNLDQVQSGKRTSQAEMNDVMVTKMDFDRALEEVRPAFGSESDALQDAIRHGMIDYGQRYRDLIDKSRLFVAQVWSCQTKVSSASHHGCCNCIGGFIGKNPFDGGAFPWSARYGKVSHVCIFGKVSTRALFSTCTRLSSVARISK
eukprot:SAG31_NODE_2797_length_5081_cov_11.092935_6_plen_171_part_00